MAMRQVDVIPIFKVSFYSIASELRINTFQTLGLTSKIKIIHLFKFINFLNSAFVLDCDIIVLVCLKNILFLMLESFIGCKSYKLGNGQAMW
jgi:hypothetical protein